MQCIKESSQKLPEIVQKNKMEASHQKLSDDLFPRKHSSQTHLLLHGPLITHVKLPCKLEISTPSFPQKDLSPQSDQVNHMFMIIFRSWLFLWVESLLLSQKEYEFQPPLSQVPLPNHEELWGSEWGRERDREKTTTLGLPCTIASVSWHVMSGRESRPQFPVSGSPLPSVMEYLSELKGNFFWERERI